MKALFVSVAFGVGALLSIGAHAADAPAGSTALCKDGTYYSGKSKRGACSGHDGIQEWYGAKGPTTDAKPATAATPATTTAGSTAATGTTADTTGTTSKKTKKKKSTDTDTTTNTADTTTPATTTAKTPSPTTTTTPATSSTTSTTHAKHEAPTPAKDIVQKPGGGAGLVWVNSESKVYHCQGDEWYGKTKEGKYETAAQAEAEGAHASHGKACTQ